MSISGYITLCSFSRNSYLNKIAKQSQKSRIAWCNSTFTVSVICKQQFSLCIRKQEFETNIKELKHFKNATQRSNLENMFRILQYPSSVPGGYGTPYSGVFRETQERGAFFGASSILKGRENCHFSIRKGNKISCKVAKAMYIEGCHILAEITTDRLNFQND